MEITQLPVASTIDPVNDVLAIVTNNTNTTGQINRNTLLNLASQPVGLTDTQTLTHKTLTSPTISGPTLSGTVTGTYTLGGTPTFPSTVVTTTGTQTLTNKTLTSPTINSPSITNATISTDDITGYTSSSSGSIYGITVTSGTIGSAALANNSVTNPAVASGGLYTSKVYNPYKFSVYRNSAQTPASPGKIEFDTKVFDTSSNYDNATNYRFTAPIAGFYKFDAGMAMAYGGSGNIFSIALYKNGSESVNGTQVLSTASQTIVGTVSALLSLAANDYVEVWSLGASTALTPGEATTYFHGYLVSAT